MSLMVRLGHCSTLARPAFRIARKACFVAPPFSLLSLCLLFFATQSLLSAGSGLNTLLVVNQNSTNSCELGNYYAEARSINPENVLRISWSGGNTSWTESDFTNTLLNPLLTALSSRQLTNQIDYVVLSMDIPFITIKSPGTTNVNSTTSALFYGLKPDTKGNNSTYGGSEAAFRTAKPSTLTGYSFLATMLTGNSLSQAKSIVDHAVASDGTFPNAPAFLEKTSDRTRNVRFSGFDNAIYNVDILGRSTLARTNSDSLPSVAPLLGLQTGLASFSVPANEFASGAMADSMTSYGGVIFGPNSQTTLLALTAAGASGSYGTVDEPFSDPQKFPNSMNYFYQSRGFSLAECYYQSVKAPFLGLVVGEPLASPFAQPGRAKWLGMISNALLSATCSMSNSAAGTLPFQKMDWFVDGKFFQTVTNVPPTAGNVLTVNIEGFPVSYVVPSNATIGTVVTGLVAKINTQALTNITKVIALPFGDRIELRSTSTNYLADPFYYVDPSATGTVSLLYRVDYLPFPEQPRFNAMSMNPATGYDLRVETTPGVPCVIEASANLKDWVPIATNVLGGEQEIIDADALNYPFRFYRLGAPGTAPFLSLDATNSGGVNLHVRTPTSLAYVIQQSTDLQHWTAVTTNAAGTNMNWFDPWATGVPGRFYRVMTLPPFLAPAAVTASTNKTSGGQVVSVSKPARAYMLKFSTNGTTWTYCLTNMSLTEGQITASSAVGSNNALTTFITTAQSTLMSSPAFGWRSEAASSQGANQQTLAGSWLQLTITKTNGAVYTVAATNQSAGPMSNLALSLLTNLSSTAGLQSSDGVLWDDFQLDPFGAPSFNLYARTPGLPAAGVKARLNASGDIDFTGGTWPLSSNMSDLQSRNHIYVTAGVTPLVSSVQFDTATLPDGYHDLTMVAYEGSSVAAQTKASIPVRIQNTPLSATLTLMDLADGSPVQGTYHVEVAANTNTVSLVSLFTTGGILATVTNQPTATFTVDGSFLRAGRHPFYALVQTSDGLQYRTETKWARLVNEP